MSECLDTDTIVTIGTALDWDVDSGLQHLQSCAACRARIDLLHATRSALLHEEPVVDAAAARIAASLAAAGRDERLRDRALERRTSLIEAVLAGIAAPALLVSAGIEVGSIVAALATAATGAALIIVGRRAFPHVV